MTLRPESGPESFVHLHVHSEFSLLDGLSRVGEMTRRVADQGMTAMALTDHGSMYGVIPFYAAAKSAGIKPIIGIEAYVAPRGMADKEGKQDADYHHMILLAKAISGSLAQGRIQHAVPRSPCGGSNGRAGDRRP